MDERSLFSGHSRPHGAHTKVRRRAPRGRYLADAIPILKVIPPGLSSDHFAEALLWALLAFLPWPFGAVEAWSETVVAVLAAGLAVCLARRFLVERRGAVWTWAYVPLAGMALMAALSMIPLPTGIVSVLSPNAVKIKQDLLAHLGSAWDLSKTTLSFYPYATARMLRLMLCAGIAFVAVVNICRTRGQVMRLLTVVAVVGGMLAVEALLQDASGEGKIYWIVPAPVKSTSGPFVNYNNFSQYMNLSIGAALGLLLMLLFGERQNSREMAGHPIARRGVGQLIVMVLLGGLAVALSTSRGGVLSLIAGGLAMGIALVLRGKSGAPLKVLAVAGLGLLLVVVAVGFESVWQRMATLSDLESASGARWRVIQDVMAFAPKFAVFGIGLGGHETVYPMFSHLPNWRTAQYVENEYIQLIEEMGIVGVVLVAGFLLVMAGNLVALIRKGRSGLVYAAMGLGFGLVAVCVGSVSDFGQRIASVSCLTAVVCGLIVAIRRIDVPAPRVEDMIEKSAVLELPPRRPRGPAWQPQALALALCGASIWMLIGSTNAAMGERHWQKVLPLEAALIKNSWQGSDAQFAQMVAESSAAARWDPDNVEYQCWMNIHQWHAEMRPAKWDPMDDEVRRELFSGLIRAFHDLETQCPTYGLNYAMAGQIRYLGLHDEGGADEIRAAYRLTPTHPAVCFIAGHLSALQGKWDEAKEEFSRAMDLHYSRDEVLNVYVNETGRPDEAAELFAGDWESLSAVAQALDKQGTSPDLAAKFREQAETVLRVAAEKPVAPVQTLAAMADLLQKQGDLTGAAAYYRRAIDGNYGAAEWHLALARVLAEMGETAQATKEAGICLRLRPDMAAAQQLLTELATPQERH